LDTKGITYDFLDDKGAWEKTILQFYERNPAGRGLDFDDAREDKPNFVKYAVEPRCFNPLTDKKKAPLPKSEELAEAVTTLTAIGLHPQKEQRNELEKPRQNAGSLID
jgi:hypothetical protein